MPNPDLRDWVAEIETADQLQRVSGAELEEEIGGKVEAFQRRTVHKAVLFDDIPGFPSGYRILENILTSVPRINITLGLPSSGRDIDLVQFWRRTMREMKSVPAVTVASGPIQDNRFSGNELDLRRIPTPKWHEEDGGYFIGTACMVIMKDPDSGWIN